MAKKKNVVLRKGKKPQPRRPLPNRPRMRVMSAPTSLDKAASEYAELLRNPCNAPLVRGVFAGTGGSLVSRFESDFIIASGGTEVAALLAFIPGAGLTFANTTALTTDTISTTFTGANYLPGATFLTGSAGSFRCLAACLQVSFPGTELGRSGIVALGVMPASSISPFLAAASGGTATATNAAQIRQICQHTERMPANMAEILWMPGDGDSAVENPQKVQAYTTANATDIEDRNAIVLSASGFPVSTGIRIRMVTVYEWTPKISVGAVATVEPSRSAFSVADVVRTLHLKNPNWYINAFKRTAGAIKTAGSVISYGAKVLGAFI